MSRNERIILCWAVSVESKSNQLSQDLGSHFVVTGLTLMQQLLQIPLVVVCSYYVLGEGARQRTSLSVLLFFQPWAVPARPPYGESLRAPSPFPVVDCSWQSCAGTNQEIVSEARIKAETEYIKYSCKPEDIGSDRNEMFH